jgi:hypothetical protein
MKHEFGSMKVAGTAFVMCRIIVSRNRIGIVYFIQDCRALIIKEVYYGW